MGGFVGDVGDFLGSAASAVVDPVSGLLNAIGVPSVGSAVAGIGSDVANIIGGGNAGTATQNAINQQDPLSANRQYFANQLMALYQNPSNYFATNPTYQFQMQQGTDAVMRNKAAQGNLVSGNTGAALEQYGQGLASQSYGTTLSQLTSLASGILRLRSCKLGVVCSGSSRRNRELRGYSASSAICSAEAVHPRVLAVCWVGRNSSALRVQAQVCLVLLVSAGTSSQPFPP